MHYARGFLGAMIALLLGACVTINVYFPAAAAEKAADKVIKEVWGEQGPQEQKPAPAPGPSSQRNEAKQPLLGQVLDFVVPAAQAQANIDVSSPAIRKLTASMKARTPRLEPYLASGAVGLTNDGMVAVRDPGSVPLASRRQVNQLVAEENRDRSALYREIASANGHPEWEQNIRSTFARRWVDNARRGWWYQDGSGHWSRK